MEAVELDLNDMMELSRRGCNPLLLFLSLYVQRPHCSLSHFVKVDFSVFHKGLTLCAPCSSHLGCGGQQKSVRYKGRKWHYYDEVGGQQFFILVSRYLEKGLEWYLEK